MKTNPSNSRAACYVSPCVPALKRVSSWLRRGAALAWCLAAFSGRADALDNAFRRPPDEARPWVYWFFMDGNLTREGITADLEAMRAAGLGGAIMVEVDVGVPRGPVHFMSPQWQTLFHHAVHEAERLGLQLTLNAGPGWTGSGGPWVPAEKSMQHVVAAETNITGPGHISAQLPLPAPRPPFFGEGTLTPELKAARDAFYRDVAVLAFPTPAAGQPIADLDEKALYYRAPFSSQPGVKPFLPAPAQFPTLPAAQCIATNAVLDLTSKMSTDGRLEWDAPAGSWTVLRFGRRSTGQTTRPAPLPGLGFECDKFDRAALDLQYQAFVATLLKGLNQRSALAGWTMLHIDSWEMSSQNWSARFREEFQRRRGYDPLRWLPVMTGRVVGSLELSERFLWDLRQTAQELVADNHARYLSELGRRDGFALSIEPYDMNPTADLNLGGIADVPMCEFWSQGHGFASEFSVLEAVSIAHTMNRPIVAAESFTSDDSERWTLYPGAMKAQGDWALCAGVNRFVFHRYQHQPWLDRWPGMTMGPYGAHWERTQTWWEMVPAYHQYVARCQYLLRFGVPQAEICYLTPEGAPHVFRPPPTATRGNPPDRLGYNFDGCSPETLIAQARVQAGRIVFPGDMSYGLLVLPRVETMTPRLLRKIEELAKAGATILGAPPRQSPSLADYPQGDAEVRRLATELWGGIAAPTNSTPASATSERSVGRGKVIWDLGFAAAEKNALNPASDLSEARWIWQAEGHPEVSAPPGRRFFQRAVVIDASQKIVEARFLGTADNHFQLWVNGNEAGQGDNFHQLYNSDVAAYLRPGTNWLALAVENSGDTPNPAGVIGALVVRFADNDRLIVPTDHRWLSSASQPAGWPNVATSDNLAVALELGANGIAPWGKIEAGAEAYNLYPDYAVAARLLAERHILPDFEANGPLRYTHRKVGAHELYFVANSEARMVEASATFRVVGKQPELWDPISGEQRDLPQFSTSAGRTTIPLRFEPNQAFFVVFRKSGKAPSAAAQNFAESRLAQTIAGPWDVKFQPGRGAPERLAFERLSDWSQHADPGIKYFSGVATYQTHFHWQANSVKDRLWLNLGEVQVMASVKLNGVELGAVWTAPFQVDATKALKPGDNTLEIRVANLWPNRLIGDTALPEKQRVTWTSWSPFKPGDRLLPSGLLGPVVLKSEPK